MHLVCLSTQETLCLYHFSFLLSSNCDAGSHLLIKIDESFFNARTMSPLERVEAILDINTVPLICCTTTFAHQNLHIGFKHKPDHKTQLGPLQWHFVDELLLFVLHHKKPLQRQTCTRNLIYNQTTSFSDGVP